MKITLKSGRAHVKHTEGGDFRQSVYRAVRQGLMQAHSVLLEPFYAFHLTIPDKMVGRAMTDLERRFAVFEGPVLEDGQAILTGRAPVSALDGYQTEVTAYTGGLGQMICTLDGYGPCHNEEEIIAAAGYDADADLANPSGSVFCTHGAGFVVNWDEVKDICIWKAAWAIPMENGGWMRSLSWVRAPRMDRRRRFGRNVDRNGRGRCDSRSHLPCK